MIVPLPRRLENGLGLVSLLVPPRSTLELCSEHSVLWESTEFATTMDMFLEPTYELDLVHGKMDDACRKYFKDKKQ